jgi:four helix bundle protein
MINKIQSFTDLIAWQEGHKLVLEVYTVTKNFPYKETYILSSQMQRCAISITSNIAEGFSRKGKKEKIQFYSTSLGSLTELQNQLIIARDLGYIEYENFVKLNLQAILVHKLINGLIKSAQNRM